jgi:hypothetical protein
MALDWTLAFPVRVADVVARVASKLPSASFEHASVVNESQSHDWIGPQVEGRPLRIPYRIYHQPLTASDQAGMSELERLVLACMYTRHADGVVRQDAARLVLSGQESFVAPFVVQLLGEYVVEISRDVLTALEARPTGQAMLELLRHFAADNDDFMALTRDRARSYWAEYYRREWPSMRNYPALVALELIAGRAAVTRP